MYRENECNANDLGSTWKSVKCYFFVWECWLLLRSVISCRSFCASRLQVLRREETYPAGTHKLNLDSSPGQGGGGLLARLACSASWGLLFSRAAPPCWNVSRRGLTGRTVSPRAGQLQVSPGCVNHYSPGSRGPPCLHLVCLLSLYQRHAEKQFWSLCVYRENCGAQFMCACRARSCLFGKPTRRKTGRQPDNSDQN